MDKKNFKKWYMEENNYYRCKCTEIYRANLHAVFSPNVGKCGPKTIPNSLTFHGVVFVTNSRLLNSLC